MATAGASFFTNVVRLALIALLGTGGYVGWRAWNREGDHVRELAERDGRIADLRRDLDAKSAEAAKLAADLADARAEVAKLGRALRFLKVDRRVARVVVLSQSAPGTAGHPVTKLRFEEVDGAGEPVGTAKEATIEGDVLYVDAWVVKFDDALVEQGDPLRGQSLCLFRRLFGEFQQPNDGIQLDAPGEAPTVYGGRDVTAAEQELWRDFWNLANDPKSAAKLGIRAAHGEAPSMKLAPGGVYKITLRASGGLTFTPDRPDAAGN